MLPKPWLRVMSRGTKKCPAGTKKCPAGTKKCPAGTKKCPAGTKNVPREQKMSRGTKKCPAGTKKSGASFFFFNTQQYPTVPNSTQQYPTVPNSTRIFLDFFENYGSNLGIKITDQNYGSKLRIKITDQNYGFFGCEKKTAPNDSPCSESCPNVFGFCPKGLEKIF